MNHKRGKPRKQRAGCKLCKPHKMNGKKPTDALEGEAYSDHVRRTAAREAFEEINKDLDDLAAGRLVVRTVVESDMPGHRSIRFVEERL